MQHCQQHTSTLCTTVVEWHSHCTPSHCHHHPQVIKRLLRPAAKVPTNPWETFMLSLSDGDAKGMWFVVSGKAALLSAPVVLAALATHLATGEWQQSKTWLGEQQQLLLRLSCVVFLTVQV